MLFKKKLVFCALSLCLRSHFVSEINNVYFNKYLLPQSHSPPISDQGLLLQRASDSMVSFLLVRVTENVKTKPYFVGSTKTD